MSRQTSAQNRGGTFHHRWLVLGLASLLRGLAVAAWARQHGANFLFHNGLEMGWLAQSILRGEGLGSPFGPPDLLQTGPTAFLAPAYPLLVAAVFRIFGVGSNASAWVMLGLNLAANLVTIWLLMQLAQRLGGGVHGKRAALVAGMAWACSPPLLFLPTIFWETSFSIALLMGLLALALKVLDQPGSWTWIALGAYCALAALVNPALLLTILGVGMVLVTTSWKRLRARDLLLGAALFALLFSPWPIRNARVFHAFIPLRTTVGFELWMGNQEGSTGFLNESLFPTYNPAELAAYRAEGELAYTRAKTLLAQRYILAHPGRFAWLSAKRMLRFWTGSGTEHGSPLFIAHSLLTTSFGLCGLWLLARRKRWQLVALLAMPLLLFPLPYYMTHAEFRYRLVIDPVLTLLGSVVVARTRLHRAPQSQL